MWKNKTWGKSNAIQVYLQENLRAEKIDIDYGAVSDKSDSEIDLDIKSSSFWTY